MGVILPLFLWKMIIDLEYLKKNVVNEKLYNFLISDNNGTAYADRLIAIVESKIKLYIDISQFADSSVDWWYTFPDNLKDVARYLVESLFLLKKENMNVTKWFIKSETEKFDDYTNSKEYKLNSILFYDIPILPDYLNILDAYRPDTISRFWHFNVLD